MGITVSNATKQALFQRPSAQSALLPVVYYPGSVLYGRGASHEVGQLSRAYGGSALLVTYLQGRTSRSGVVDRVLTALQTAGIKVTLHEVKPSPDLSTIDDGAAALRACGADFVVGVGGGSVLDTAKAIAVLAPNEGCWEDYQLARKTFQKPAVPVVAVPTTSGTGSEATAVSVVSNPTHGIIKSVSHPTMLPRLVVLDPELTISLPSRLTALVGLDAFSHAIESYVSPKASPFTEAAGLEAFRLLSRSLLRAVRNGQDIEARGDLALASHFAGQALNAGVGAAHILAQPISAVLGIGHPEALSTVLQYVVAYNEDYETAEPKYRQVVEIMGPEDGAQVRPSDLVGQFLVDLGLNQKLSDYGATRETVPAILDAVVRSTGHIWTNPRPVTLEALEDILLKAL